MSDPHKPTVPTPPCIEPVESYRDCHRGIRSQLERLEQMPALAEALIQARQTAAELVLFFDDAIEKHHRAEERELFPAILKAAAPGAEQDRARRLVDRLSAEHLSIESQWSRLRPGLRRITRGEETLLDAAAVARLVTDYRQHAALEENEFLPLAETILGRVDEELAGLARHIHSASARRTPPL